MQAPLLIRGRRTAAGGGAYFDLVTDDSRRFYGDNLHFGYFPRGDETLADAHDAHTDLVAALAELRDGQRVLDIGCGLGAPGVRMARRHGCDITRINISREQVRQGREMLAEQGFTVFSQRCILEQTMPTWEHVRSIYAGRDSELARRYGSTISQRICANIERLPEILRRLGTFPVLAARKPLDA